MYESFHKHQVNEWSSWEWSARKITEGLWQLVYERSMTMTKILCTLARGPLDVEALGFSLPNL